MNNLMLRLLGKAWQKSRVAKSQDMLKYLKFREDYSLDHIDLITIYHKWEI